MEKKYQVFISSTYLDLIEERTKIIQTLLGMECIPAGMEGFPAIDEEQFNYIKKIIDYCDYYIIIIAGKYGSISPVDGVSYTEKEYDYAVSKGIKILAFIHENTENLLKIKTEKDEMATQKLMNFRQKVSKQKLVKFWSTSEQLCTEVSKSLDITMRIFPSSGWVRDFPIPSKHNIFYDSLKNNLKDLTRDVVYLNEKSDKYRLLIYNWIIKNKHEKSKQDPSGSIKISVLNPGEKTRQIFGGIITSLEDGDNYHTISTLSFWINDLESNEIEFIEDNLSAINKKVKVERVILVESELFEIPIKNKLRINGLDNLVKKFLKLIANDQRNFSQIHTTFVIIPSVELLEFKDVPMATVFSDVEIDQENCEFLTKSINDATNIMQITSTKNAKYESQAQNGVNIEFFNERNRNKIFKNESRFLKIQKHSSALNIFQMHDRLNELNKNSNFRIVKKSANNKDIFNIYTGVFSIIECHFRGKDGESTLNNPLVKVKNPENQSFTLVDESKKIENAIKNGDLILLDESSTGGKRETHNWKLFKIEVTDAINLYGVASKISSGFSALDIPICLFTIFDGVLLFLQHENYKTAIDFLFKEYEIGTIEGNPI